MDKKYKIGIFDSGIGGLSILKEMFNLMPSLEVHYIADHDFAPYGEKNDEQIKERCQLISKQLQERGVELIVVACNTATASGIDYLRKSCDLPFVGVEPYLNLQNQMSLNESRVVAMTTELMGKSKRFQQLKERLDPEQQMSYVSFPRLASLIENAYAGEIDSGLMDEIRIELMPLKNADFTHAVLGCTHYPLIADIISDYLGVETISPCPYVAKRVQALLSVSEPEEGPTATDFWFMSTRNKTWNKKGLSELSLTWPVLE
jgi:glutamate racemase